jgi:FkbM family methyltransferase
MSSMYDRWEYDFYSPHTHGKLNMLDVAKSYFKLLGLKGLALAIWAKLTRTQHLLRVHPSDCKFSFLLRVPSSDVPTFKKIFLDLEYNFPVNTSPEIIVDAGANTGLSAIYFANKFPKSKILALEPEASNFDLLKINVSPYSNIIAVQCALWDRCTEIDVTDPGIGKWGFNTKEKSQSKESDRICHSTHGVTVDRIIEQWRLEKIDLLKIDIEGAEKEVFRDTSAWITRVNTIAIELHDRLKTGCSRKFYEGTPGYDLEYRNGENIFVCNSAIPAESRVLRTTPELSGNDSPQK